MTVKIKTPKASSRSKTITIRIPPQTSKSAKQSSATQKIVITHPSKKEFKAVTDKVIKQYKLAIKKLSRS